MNFRSDAAWLGLASIFINFLVLARKELILVECGGGKCRRTKFACQSVTTDQPGHGLCEPRLTKWVDDNLIDEVIDG